jgi:hypothetical protein
MGFIPFVPTGSDITLPVTIPEGGTGQITAPAALSALGGVTNANDLGGTSAAPTVVATHLASALPIAQGGSGQATAAAALSALGGAAVAGDIGNTSASPQVVSTHLSAALPIAQGGTGQTARTAAAGFAPANPSATASTSLVMMGLGSTVTYTPTGSGTVLVIVTGYAETNTATTVMTIGPRYGTGTAPVNGAAVTGTRFGFSTDLAMRSPTAVTDNPACFGANAVISGLTAATAYWFDLALLTSSASDTAQMYTVMFSIIELF